MQSDSPTEVLKAFLAKEHDFGEISYTWRFTRGQTIPGTKIRIPDTPSVFKAKWQPGSSFFMQLESTNGLLTLAKDQVAMVVGNAGNDVWRYENGYLHRYARDEVGSASGTHANHRAEADQQLFTALGFGIPYLPGSLTWDGMSFKGTGFDKHVFQGELRVSQKGLPDKILIPPVSLGRPVYCIQLYYDVPPTGASLPSGYDYLETLTNGTEHSAIEVRILSLSTTNVASPECAFQPEALLPWGFASPPSPQTKARPLETIVHSNHQEYVAQSNGLVLLPKVATGSGLYKKLVIYAVLGTTAAFTAFVVRTRKNKRTNSKSNQIGSAP